MTSETILKLNHIFKTFPGVVALDDVHFDLRKGEVHVLLGENGAGKSTLVKILSGAYQKSSGTILLNQQEIHIKNPKHSQELGISTIYQELNLVPHLSVGENIFLGREPVKSLGIVDFMNLFAKAQNILNDLGVEIDARSLVKDLGIAKQQMVEVAKALSLDATIVIMDEPTSSLTEQEIEELFKIIKSLKANGISIIYISHRLEEIFEIGDRITVLRDGKWIGTKHIAEVTQPDLIRMMVNRELKDKFPKQKAKQGNEVLRIENFRNNHLKEISFSLCAGEVLGIAGLLGAGRTELARAIFGVDKIDSGKMYIKGLNYKIKSPRSSINLGIGYLTEDRKSQGLILNLSVKENVCLPNLDRFSKFGVMNAKKECATVERYVNELHIKTPGLNQKIMYLSGGNQQKVVMSKWLCSNVDILIFDEPTRGIDVGSKVEIYQLMNRLTAEGVGILMISSELPEILGMSDRILVMHEGRIAGEFLAEEATQEMILKCALGA
jgi:ribose transport system ATP-binding protein